MIAAELVLVGLEMLPLPGKGLRDKKLTGFHMVFKISVDSGVAAKQTRKQHILKYTKCTGNTSKAFELMSQKITMIEEYIF